MLLLAIYLAVGALAAACTAEANTQDCTDNQCEKVGTVEICTQCKSGSAKFPINGVCTAEINGNTYCSANEKCTQCKSGYFLHKGDCYKFGNEIAVLICNDAVAGDVEGVCSKCNIAGGFFQNPEAAATTDSCISCGDATGVTVGSNKYKGVLNCATCTAPEKAGSGVTEKTATCTKCITAKYLSTDGTCVASCTQDVQFSTEDDENGKRCFLCSDATNKGVTGCAKCTYTSPNANATCTECTSDYLKTVDRATTCVTDCGPGFFKNDKGGASNSLKVCSPCAVNCLTCTDGTADKCTSCTAGTHFLLVATGSQGKCVSCGDATSGVPNCAKCAAPSSAGQKPTCSEYSNNRIVKTDNDVTSCVTDDECTKAEGFFIDSTSGKKCTACSENCRTCSGAAAQCTSCKTDTPYLKKTDGLQTGTCVDAAGCTNGNTYYADDADPRTCKACAKGTFEGCETCEKSTDGAVVCKTCGPQKKIRPDKKGCIDACPPDVSTEKNGVCECVEGYAPSADGSSCASSSANRSGLSTGAIAGISVAAVVVVGGLVGFLCWCLCAARRDDTRLGSRQSHLIPAVSQTTTCSRLTCRCPLGALSTPDSSPCGKWATGTI
ncbi:Variant-specific surface protein [Giardia duodenalis]|uniref:Variant-specific surface protein n=1 Tax=Giardia intestinalis TaxID=5741 RepID=V6TSI3_GIAIN|nr:Variant-specific surface protein [Giardia intestinalis]